MHRTLTLGLVVAFLSMTFSEAHAERKLGFSGQGTVSTAGTFYIGAQAVDSPTITTILGPATLTPYEDGYLLRDRFMPMLGILNVGKRDGNGIRVFHGDNVQFWVSLNQTDWHLIEGNDGLTINGMNFSDIGSNGLLTPVAAAPAVGEYGLVVMVLVGLIAGTMIFRRRIFSLS